jgi:hypothetical protein
VGPVLLRPAAAPAGLVAVPGSAAGCVGSLLCSRLPGLLAFVSMRTMSMVLVGFHVVVAAAIQAGTPAPTPYLCPTIEVSCEPQS